MLLIVLRKNSPNNSIDVLYCTNNEQINRYKFEEYDWVILIVLSYVRIVLGEDEYTSPTTMIDYIYWLILLIWIGLLLST